ncbi:hypothetical protein IFM89_038574 [Coptis chinensis]|uniref:Uncharacterized protein n=1 Tax=Coptis chinensis TaxID=261450 RepID=A0A835HF82_9MAGN|nr:hypothetical protein IFM89_038574 [Coptis chinensis]
MTKLTSLRRDFATMGYNPSLYTFPELEPSHKSFMIKKKLAKKMRRSSAYSSSDPDARLDSTIRTETVLLDWLTGLATSALIEEERN